MTKTYELKHPNGFVLGVAAERRDGWYFIPYISGRMTSRMPHKTADACLPAWARKRLKAGCSFLPPERKEA